MTERQDPMREKLVGAVEDAIARGEVPGAVLLVGREGKVLFHEAFGRAQVEPEERPMKRDTILDAASLTKPCVTALAVMLLADEGALSLRDRVIRWLPSFAGGGKDAVCLLDLLTHSGGMDDAGLYDPVHPMTTLAAVLDLLWGKKLFAPPGTEYRYADLNYIALGKVVEAAAGMSLDAFFSARIARPLGMRDSGFNPPPEKLGRIAATEKIDGQVLVGKVHDPRARDLGGVAGHAGLFSTVQDLFAIPQMLLNQGKWKGRRVLSAPAAALMIRVQSPPGLHPRAIGWDTDPGASGPRGDLFPTGGFGHTGFTGTSIWADPGSGSVIVLLTNRVHPDGVGAADPLRRRVANVVAACFASPEKARALRGGGVLTGADVLAGTSFRRLKGKRVGLVTNLSVLNREGKTTLQLLAAAPDVTLATIFTPEHGLEAKLEGKIASGTHERLEIPVVSLYGDNYRPSRESLAGLDVLVLDLPDVGVRFYTYAATLGYCLEEAARAKLSVMVLDRPNPLTGTRVAGPKLERDRFGLTGYTALPVTHGMTFGELGRLFNAERGCGADLEVVKMKGWRRNMWFDETGLPWANPSPNIRSLTQAILYPAVGLLEAANLSVGRGTDTPFEWFGAPWLNGTALARALNAFGLPGVGFHSESRTPSAGPYAGGACSGCAVHLTDRNAFRPVLTGVAIADAINNLHAEEFKLEGLDSMIGTPEPRLALRRAMTPEQIEESWIGEEERFRKTRAKYLLY